MKNRIVTILLIIVFAGSIRFLPAQEVSIPDPGLNAAVREALQKPTGPLTTQDLLSLTTLDAHSRNVTNLTGLEAARNLATLDLRGNQITNVVLLPHMTNLTTLVLDDNPIQMLVLSEPMATANLAGAVTNLQNQGVPVFAYPLMPQLVRPLQLVGAFKFGLIGPPGTYTILQSTNLSDWSALGTVSNPLGAINFTDVTAHDIPQRFYRAVPTTSP